jgi:diguanylate cyclase (GGDEF)-like protein/PAS domain S-box-containing protein
MDEGNNSHWRALLGAGADALAEGLVVLDGDGRVRASNAAARRILGGSPERFLGVPPPSQESAAVGADGEPLAPEDHPVTQALRDGEARAGIRVGLDLPEGRRWLSMSASPLSKAGASRPYGVVGCFLDVTAEVEATERRRAVEAQRLAVVERAPVPIVVLDREDVVRTWNRAAEDLFGWEAAEVLGGPVPFVPPDKLAEFDAHRAPERRGEMTSGREVRRVRRDGTSIDLEVFSAPMWDRDGHVYATLAVLVDVTRRRATVDALAAQERRWRTLAAVAPVGIFTTNPRGWCTYVNERWCEVTGLTPDHALEEGRLSAVHPDDREDVRRHWRAAVAARAEHAGEFRILRPDGTVRFVTEHARPVVDAEGRSAGYVGTVADVTASREAQAALAAAEERFRRIFEDAPTGMALVELDGRLTDVNAAFCDLLRRDREDLIGRDAQTLSHPDDVAPGREQARRVIDGSLPTAQTETRLLRSDGTYLWALVHAAGLGGEAGGRPRALIGQVHDITERRRLEAQMRELADQDSLTGLLNRRRFGEELERHVEAIRGYGPTGALILLDLDHFKNVNDGYGHDAGDRLLVGVAALLRERLRATDVLARLGGDEFGVLLPRADAAEASRVAEQLVAIVRERGELPDVPSAVTVCVGVALFDGRDPKQTMIDADVALYRAKAAGRDRACLFIASEPDPA